MDMPSMPGMTMPGMTMHPSSTTMATSTTGMVMPEASTAMRSTHSMGMSHVVGSAGQVCKIQMLWNWNTVGACFITPQWQIASSGGMIGSCFGVVFLVMALEMLRRAAKELDRWIIHRHKQAAEAHHQQAPPPAPEDDNRASQQSLPVLDMAPGGAAPRSAAGGEPEARSGRPSSTAAGSDVSGGGDAAASVREKNAPGPAAGGGDGGAGVVAAGGNCRAQPCRPNLWQQGLRALLHAAQFTVAYFIMLLAMNYNGYIIISIIIGSYLGSFLFSWENLSYGPRSNTSAAEEVTVCCS